MRVQRPRCLSFSGKRSGGFILRRTLLLSEEWKLDTKLSIETHHLTSLFQKERKNSLKFNQFLAIL